MREPFLNQYEPVTQSEIVADGVDITLLRKQVGLRPRINRKRELKIAIEHNEIPKICMGTSKKHVSDLKNVKNK